MDEFERIALISKKVKRSKRVAIGIGDDAALVKSPKGKTLLTVDSLVEGVHFDLKYSSPQDLGYKALAVNLSDIAAMGGKPLYALVSLGCSPKQGPEFLAGFYDGLGSLAKQFGVDVVGGNLSASDKLFTDISVVGEVQGRALTRAGARVGDWIAVTGFLGGSSQGLQLLKRGYMPSPAAKEVIHKHLRPVPRVKEGQALQKIAGVHAAIDISDGLASELHHLAEASKVGMEIQADFIPIAPAVRRLCAEDKSDPLNAALYGGEEYELLITVSSAGLKAAQRSLRRLHGNLIVIGRVVKSKGVRLLRKEQAPEKLEPRGWRHWA